MRIGGIDEALRVRDDLESVLNAGGMEGRYCMESAAVSDEEYGNPIYPPARNCLSRHGVWFDWEKRARTVVREDYDRFDRLICMDSSNLRWLRGIIPEDPEGKVHLLMTYAGSERDVADPWYTGDFETTYRDILEGCEAMLKLDSRNNKV